MQSGIQSGLPQYPNGLQDREAALVLPLYRAIDALAAQVSAALGLSSYSVSELNGLDRAQGLQAGNTHKITILAGEDLTFGNMLSLAVVSGDIVAMKADATNPLKPAMAVLDITAGLLTGKVGTAIFLQGRTRGITGTVFGATYYLSTAGTITTAPPTADTHLKQVVGIGLGSAGFYANIIQVGKVVFNVYTPTAGTLRVQYTDGSTADYTV